MTHDTTGDREEELHLALAEYLRHIDAGEQVDREEFLAEHPAIASELVELLATADQIQQMAGPVVDCDVPLPAEGAARPDHALGDTVTFHANRFDATSHHEAGVGPTAARGFGEYELLEELGRGGMGVVYKANQMSIGRTVAVKMIRSGRLATETDVARFYLEAQAAGKLGHSGIVDIYDAGEVEGHHYFSMEYVEGTTLAQLLRSGPLQKERIVHYLKPVCEAIHFAHENGVLHRDLKPSNILIDADDHPKVTDFGLAKDVTQDEQLTTSGSALGTPSYMSPEQAQARRDEVGRGTDVYALGAILYEMLTGQPPFRGESVIGTILQVIQDEPVPPASVNPDCNRDLEAVCLKCLHKDPGERYATVEALAHELDRVATGQPVHARRISTARRAWYWMRDVPLVAAAIGRKAANPTVWHVRLQWVVIILAVMLASAALVVPTLVTNARFQTFQIAAGPKDGTYYDVADSLAQAIGASKRSEVVETKGTVESLDRLMRGEVNLAIVQENALAKNGKAMIVAPLYDETVLVLVRNESGIERIPDLAGRSVSLGDEKTGMWLTSQAILGEYGVLSEIVVSPAEFTAIVEDDGPIAAIVTAKFDDRRLQAILQSGKVRAIPITRRVPALSEHVEDEEQPWLPRGGLRTLQTRAVLSVRSRTPDWFVKDCLEALYGSDIPHREGFFPLQSSWSNLNLHPAAEEFFDERAR